MRIIVGVSGGIAAYKACDLVRFFIKAGMTVKVIMTENAKSFVHKNTFAALTRDVVYDDVFEDPMHHITLAKWADCIVIAPATASLISRLSVGLANDLLTTVCLASTAPIFVAPAMNKIMWENTITQENIKKLQQHHYHIIFPASGEQACGDVGLGRMVEPQDIADVVLMNQQPLKHLKIIITAGPTQEKIDPVRYISNRSSGKMGYALADAFIRQGATVTLISGPTALEKPKHCDYVAVCSADDMIAAVNDHIQSAHIFICAAAIADYKPKQAMTTKIKKTQDALSLALIKTTDLLKSIAHTNTSLFTVGFCAETESLMAAAQHKLRDKSLNAIIANQISPTGYPFDEETNVVTYLRQNETFSELGQDTKKALATQLVKLIVEDYRYRSHIINVR